jgi:hypothetical protein
MLVPVQVRLGVNSETGQIDRDAPFMVWGEAAPDHHPAIYDDAPQVIVQMARDEQQARFTAEWAGERWCIGQRIVG